MTHYSIFFQTLLEVMSLQLMTKIYHWINKEIKCKIKSKNKTFQQYFKNGRKITDFEIVDKETTGLSEIIPNRKEKYFHGLSLKLNKSQTGLKTYWSIIKPCYNGRKIPIIPPLTVNEKIVTNFTEKANLFNKYFSSHCNLHPSPNDSKLPENQTYIRS